MVLGKLINYLQKKKARKNPSRLKSTKNKKVKKSRLKTKATPKQKSVKKEKLVALATHYFSKIKVAVLKMKDTLKTGDKIHVKGFTTDFVQMVTSIQIDREPIKMAKKGQEIGLLVKGKVRHKDKVYKI